MSETAPPKKKKSRTLLMTSVALAGVLCLTLLMMWCWRGSRESVAVSPTTRRAAVPTSAPSLETEDEAGMGRPVDRRGGVH